MRRHSLSPSQQLRAAVLTACASDVQAVADWPLSSMASACLTCGDDGLVSAALLLLPRLPTAALQQEALLLHARLAALLECHEELERWCPGARLRQTALEVLLQLSEGNGSRAGALSVALRDPDAGVRRRALQHVAAMPPEALHEGGANLREALAYAESHGLLLDGVDLNDAAGLAPWSRLQGRRSAVREELKAYAAGLALADTVPDCC
jgi:hypothetical protein